MILKVLPLAILQSVLLASGQVLLKNALNNMPKFGWSAFFFKSVIKNWQFAVCGLCYAAACFLWMYITKRFPLSVAYPMVSLSYIFGMIAAIVFFHEHVDALKWIGVFLIMTGCIFIAK